MHQGKTIELLGQTSHRREQFHIALTQSYFTFVQSIPLTAFIGLLIGLIVTFQVQLGLSFIGGYQKLGQILAIILFRELTPFCVTVLIIIRSVTAVTSELATMKVQQEIDALETMGIPIKDYIIVPRVLAGGFSFFCMAVIFLISALFGSWVGANLNSTLPFNALLGSFSSSITGTDVLFFVIKNTFIGSFIFHLACRRGLSLKKAPFEVPIVTNKSVVDCLMAGIFLQISFSIIFYLIVGFNL